MLGKLNFASQDLHSSTIDAMGGYCPPALLGKSYEFFIQT